MMGDAFLDHHGDPTAQLVIDVLDGQRMLLQEEVEAAANVQQRHVVLGQFTDLVKALRPERGVVGVDARDFFGVGRGPRCIR